MIILNPSWEGSWLHTPKPKGNNSIGYWPPKTKFPGAAEGIMVPAEFKNKVPIKFDFYIKDEELKTYLEAPKWSDKNGYIFENSTIALAKNNMCPVVDKSLRDQLTDNLVTDEFIDITDNLVKSASNLQRDNPRVDSKYMVELLLGKLALIRKSVMLSAASNLRGRHNILAGIVRNKVVLREEVLSAHKGGAGSANTREALLGSSFFSADLFGPVPESVSQNCVKNAQYILKPNKASSARPSYPAPNNSSVPSSSVEYIRTVTDDTASPNSKKAKVSHNQGFRSPTNPTRSRHKPGKSFYSQNRRGGK